ncbi:MAG: hypothetical protein FWE32_04875 [Oscillospiraceae bacterium]|nr:hypothetical protein [Oscillospiraceae bacterium]
MNRSIVERRKYRNNLIKCICARSRRFSPQKLQRHDTKTLESISKLISDNAYTPMAINIFTPREE